MNHLNLRGQPPQLPTAAPSPRHRFDQAPVPLPVAVRCRSGVPVQGTVRNGGTREVFSNDGWLNGGAKCSAFDGVLKLWYD